MKGNRTMRWALLGLLVELLSLLGGCGGGAAPTGCPCIILQVAGTGHADGLILSALDARGAVLKSKDAGPADLPIAVRLAVGPAWQPQLATLRVAARRAGQVVASVDVSTATLPFDDDMFRQEIDLGDIGE